MKHSNELKKGSQIVYSEEHYSHLVFVLWHKAEGFSFFSECDGDVELLFVSSESALNSREASEFASRFVEQNIDLSPEGVVEAMNREKLSREFNFDTDTGVSFAKYLRVSHPNELVDTAALTWVANDECLIDCTLVGGGNVKKHHQIGIPIFF
jgi:hypothetical protein